MKLRRPSPAMAVACVALGVALGGTATAARTLLTGKDIAPGAITARNLAPGAVTLQKLAPSARPVHVASLPGIQGPQGPPGPQGAQGLQGPAGGLDPNKLTALIGPDIVVPAGAVGSAQAFCPAGQRATGGGFFSSVAASAASIPGTSSWAVIVNNNTPIAVTINAYVVCVAP